MKKNSWKKVFAWLFALVMILSLVRTEVGATVLPELENVSAAPLLSDTNSDNGFYARALNGQDTFTVTYGESVTMRVDAGCDQGELHYEWYREGDFNPIEGATEASLTVENVVSRMFGWCEVSDDYDHIESVMFYIYVDNHLQAEALNGQDTITVSLGDSVTLQVEASCIAGEIRYEWFDEEGNQIEGANSESYTLKNVTKYQRFRCHVNDDFGARKDIWFEVRIENGFYAWPAGEDQFRVSYGDVVTLEVEAGCADGELHYEWYVLVDGDGWNRIEGADSGICEYEVPTVEMDCYAIMCLVTDDYGNPAEIHFLIRVLKYSQTRDFTREQIRLRFCVSLHNAEKHIETF